MADLKWADVQLGSLLFFCTGSCFSGNLYFALDCIWAWYEGEVAWNQNVCVSRSHHAQGTITVNLFSMKFFTHSLLDICMETVLLYVYR